MSHPAPSSARLERLLRARRRRRGQRGVALIMVLGALTILTVMLTEFQDETSAELGSALSERDSVNAEYAAVSAVNLTRLLIASEPTIRKSLTPILAFMFRGSPPQIPVWEHADAVLGAFRDQAGTDAFAAMAGFNASDAKNLGLSGASFELKIVDEDSRINVNMASKGSAFGQQRLAQQLLGMMIGPHYDPMFERRDGDGNFHDRQTICSAIIDWSDPDQDLFPCDVQTDTAQATAAEDSFYQLSKTPYERKNAAFDSLEELRLVRGVTDDFWSTFVDPKDDPASRVLTVWGSDAVNVNTANAQTLLSLVVTYADPAEPIRTDPAEQLKYLMAMEMLRSMTPGVPLFGSPKKFVSAVQGKGPFGMMLAGVGLKPVKLVSEELLTKAISTESKVFSIYATGVVKAGKRETRVRVHTVVDFRKAPPPGMARQQAAEETLRNASGQDPAAALPPANQTGGATGLPEGATEDAILNALQPSPGGNVVYYRVD
jgi:general secretion pathway protein K